MQEEFRGYLDFFLQELLKNSDDISSADEHQLCLTDNSDDRRIFEYHAGAIITRS